MSTPGALKVLHVTETLPGGIATYLRELVLLHKDDPAIAEIRVLAPRDQLSHLKELPSGMLRGYERTGRNLRSLWSLSVALRAQVAELGPCVIHLHSSFAGTIGRLLRFCLPPDVRIVYCPHGWAFSRDGGWITRLTYIWIERLLASCAHAWIAISQHELDAASAVGIRSNHAHMIYNGVSDTQEVPVEPLPEMNPGYINLLFVGRHDRQKGLDIVLSVMPKLAQQKIRLYVVGAGVIDDMQQTQNVGNITWLGWRSGTDLIACYRACSAVIMPSRWEGMGLVAAEAMREGKPVVASQRGALPEVVGDGGILFDPENAEALLALLLRLDSAQLLALGLKARARYLQCFQSERMGQEVMALYQGLKMQEHRTE